MLHSNLAESFHLKVSEVIREYTKIHSNASDVFYHYTTHSGLKGILSSGGLWATYRMRMNDTGEFEYARDVVYEALDEVGQCHTLPNIAQSLTTYIRKNLDKFHNNTTEKSGMYCACLTVSSDNPKQWETYAECGKGFAIGIDLHHLLRVHIPKVRSKQPYIYCAPVMYNESDQRDLVWRLVKVGIYDLQNFAKTCSEKREDITALRDRVSKEIVVQLLVHINFIKAPKYSSEKEMRLFLDPNVGTLETVNIQHYPRNNESIPFIFMDLCNPNTKRLPLAEIMVGPNATFFEEKAFLEDLLDELGYGSNYWDRPRITKSLIVMDDRF